MNTKRAINVISQTLPVSGDSLHLEFEIKTGACNQFVHTADPHKTDSRAIEIQSWDTLLYFDAASEDERYLVVWIPVLKDEAQSCFEVPRYKLRPWRRGVVQHKDMVDQCLYKKAYPAEPWQNKTSRGSPPARSKEGAT